MGTKSKKDRPKNKKQKNHIQKIPY